jgi:ATP-binding cassette subfamily B protein
MDGETGREKVKKKAGLMRLIEIAGTKKWWLFGSMFLGVMATVAQFVPFVAVYLIITELARHADSLAGINREYVFTLGYISLAAVAAYGVLLYTSTMLSHIAAFNILYEIRVILADKLSRLSMGYFTKKATGEIKKVLSEDVERIELFVAHHIPDLTSAILFPLILIGYLFYLDWRLALASLVPLPIAFLVQAKMFISPASRKAYDDYHKGLEKMNATVVEYVRGMPVVKVFNQSVDAFARLKNDIYEYMGFTKRITKAYSVIYP